MSPLGGDIDLSVAVTRALPMRLAALHRRLVPGTRVRLRARARSAAPDTPALAAIAVGAGFGVRRARADEVTAERIVSLPDTVGARMRVLVVGLNPSIYAAERGVGFARGSNRFWTAALAAGLVTRDRDPAHALRVDRVGMTDLCKRATVASSELTRDEYREGARRVEQLVRWLRPRVVAFVGLEGWRAAIDLDATAGPQPDRFGGSVAYVLPSTSGLNAHAQLAGLVDHFREAIGLVSRA